MNAKELRIGNLVLNEYSEPEYIIAINTYSAKLSASVDGDSVNRLKLQEIEPIQLTKEWLLKFGFVEEFENKFYKNSIAIEILS